MKFSLYMNRRVFVMVRDNKASLPYFRQDKHDIIGPVDYLYNEILIVIGSL